MKIGIFTQCIQADSIEALADKVSSYNIQSVVLDSFPNLDINLDDPSQEHCIRIKRAFTNAGVDIASVGGYSNLLHPDPESRKAIHKRFRGLMKLSHKIGSPMLCSETGTYHPESDWEWDPSNATEQAYQEFIQTIRPLLRDAEEYGVVLGFEPYVMNVIYTSERANRFMRELDSSNARLVMDPAGILTRATLNHQEEVIQEAFQYMSPYMGLVHVEDCQPHPRDHFHFLGAGQGLINYPLFMDLIVGSGYEGPLVLEHMQETDIPATRDFVVNHLSRAIERKGEIKS